MDKIPRHALVLFDVDGCTSIVVTGKLKSSHDLKPSLKCSLIHQRTEYKVEVLQLSDSKQELNKFEKEWARSQRARALDREKSVRPDSENGYLLVWPEEEVHVMPPRPSVTRRPGRPRTVPLASDEPVLPATEETLPPRPSVTRRPGRPRTVPLASDEPVPPATEEIVGSNDRTITVHFQGLAEDSQQSAAPQRSPVFFNDLTQDERDCVQAQVVDFQNNKVSIATQTEDVLIFNNKDELLAAYDPKGRSLTDLFNTLQGHGNKITEIQNTLLSLKNCEIVQEILSIVKGLKDDRDVSKLLQIGILNDFNTSTDSEGREQDARTQIASPDTENPSMNASPEIIQNDDPTPDCEYTHRENIDLEEASLFFPNAVTANRLDNDFIAEQEKPSAKKFLPRTSPTLQASSTFSHNLMCNTGPIVEIDSHLDMESVDLNAEVRISPYLQKQCQVTTNWPGGFAWQITQRIYKTHELVGRNYYGRFQKQCLSPRRRHAIEHAIIETIGDDISILRKAVEGINTGIRNKTNKGRSKDARPPMAPRPLFTHDAYGSSV